MRLPPFEHASINELASGPVGVPGIKIAPNPDDGFSSLTFRPPQLYERSI